ncbi:Myotubularin- protein 14 [Sorochytrium milnesiophthora]
MANSTPSAADDASAAGASPTTHPSNANKPADSATPVTEASVRDLLAFYWSFQHSYSSHWNPFWKSEPKLQHIQSRVEQLYARDYTISTVANADYCSTYPLNLVIPVRQQKQQQQVNDPAVLSGLFKKSRFARVRSRFVVPAILYNNVNICRSSTLSNEAEVLLNMLNEKTKQLLWSGQASDSSDAEAAGDESAAQATMVDRQRLADIALLKELRVGYVADLMVEQRKVKYGLTITSSEKADSQQRYARAGLEIASMPYPGVEFFRMFKANGYCGRSLRFDWTQPFANAELSIPAHVGTRDGDGATLVQWDEYKSWDLVQLTQNYLRHLVQQLRQPTAGSSSQHRGMLVHCISGWDRTPAFISWLRLSLWADGVIHESLSPLEMLYFTVGYDWLLFSHLLADRTQRGEDIFSFCFYFLMHMLDDDFSVLARGAAPERAAARSANGSISISALTQALGGGAQSLCSDGCDGDAEDGNDTAVLDNDDNDDNDDDDKDGDGAPPFQTAAASLCSSASSAMAMSYLESDMAAEKALVGASPIPNAQSSATRPVDIPSSVAHRRRDRNMDAPARSLAHTCAASLSTSSLPSSTPAPQARQQPPLPVTQSSSWQFVSLLQGSSESLKQPLSPSASAQQQQRPMRRAEISLPSCSQQSSSMFADPAPSAQSVESQRPSLRRRYSSHDDFLYVAGGLDDDDPDLPPRAGNTVAGSLVDTADGLGISSPHAQQGKRRYRQAHSDSDEPSFTGTDSGPLRHAHSAGEGRVARAGVAFSDCLCCQDEGLAADVLPMANALSLEDSLCIVESQGELHSTLDTVQPLPPTPRSAVASQFGSTQPESLPTPPRSATPADTPTPTPTPQPPTRAEKLMAVRRLFVKLYLDIFRDTLEARAPRSSATAAAAPSTSLSSLDDASLLSMSLSSDSSSLGASLRRGQQQRQQQQQQQRQPRAPAHPMRSPSPCGSPFNERSNYFEFHPPVQSAPPSSVDAPLSSTASNAMEAAKSSFTSGLKNLGFIMKNIAIAPSTSSSAAAATDAKEQPLRPQHISPSPAPIHYRRPHSLTPPIPDSHHSSWQRRVNY